MDFTMNTTNQPIDWSNLAVDSTTYKVGTVRMVSTEVVHLRWLIKRDGTKVLQGGYPWSEGISRGIEWKDIPTVIEEHPDRL